jgi:hypothetical protein
LESIAESDTAPFKDRSTSGTTKQAVLGLAALALVPWLALFLPAYSLEYWQAWAYWLIFLVWVSAISAYFLKNDQRLI